MLKKETLMDYISKCFDARFPKKEILMGGMGCENYAVAPLFFLNFPYLLQDLLS